MKLFVLIISSFVITSSFAVESAFTSTASASVNVSGGNSNFETYILKSDNSYSFGRNILSLNGNYNYGESDDVRSLESWYAQIKYELKFNKDFNSYLAQSIESNRFSGIDRRYNSDAGLKYRFITGDKFGLLGELGYRYTLEQSTDHMVKDKHDSKGRVFLEASSKFEKNLAAKLWAEYLPNFSNSDDYQFNFEPSLTVQLNNNFSMQSAYLWKYDNVVLSGTSKHEYMYTLSLIARM